MGVPCLSTQLKGNREAVRLPHSLLASGPPHRKGAAVCPGRAVLGPRCHHAVGVTEVWLSV